MQKEYTYWLVKRSIIADFRSIFPFRYFPTGSFSKETQNHCAFFEEFSISAEISSGYPEDVSAPVENLPFPPVMVSTHVENLIRPLKERFYFCRISARSPRGRFLHL